MKNLILYFFKIYFNTKFIINISILKTSDETSKFYKKDDIDLLSNYVIPDNLEYRIISMKSEYINVISDVV